MAMNRLLLPAILFAVLLFLMEYLFPGLLVTNWIGAVTLTVGILYTLKTFNVLGSLVNGLPGKKNDAKLIALLGVVAGILMIPAIPAMVGIDLPGIKASFTGGAIGVPASFTGAQCTVANPEILGKAATYTANLFDLESNTPFSAAVDGKALVYKNGVFHKAITDTTDGTVSSNLAVGDTLSIYENAPLSSGITYYIEPVENLCVNKERETVSLDGHTAVANSNLATTCYDETGAATCSSGTTANEEDYDITLGASQEKKFFLKVAVNSANKAYRLGGVAMIQDNDISKCEPSGAEWSAIPVPDFLQTSISLNASAASGTNRTSGYDEVYVLNNAVMLSEWDEKKYEFVIQAGSSDPSTSNDPDGSDVCVAVWLDAAWAPDSNNMPVLDVFQHDDGEGDVGIKDDYAFPVGGTGGVIIEGI